MICSGVRVLEDPYDYVMRKSDAMKIKIVPSTGRNTMTPAVNVTCSDESVIGDRSAT